MSGEPPRRLRYALVGAGARAEMFIRSLVLDHRATAQLVALADVNQARMDVHNAWLEELGVDAVPTYPARDFATMLEKERVDAAIVTTVDATHDEYIVAALRAGAIMAYSPPAAACSPDDPAATRGPSSRACPRAARE